MASVKFYLDKRSKKQDGTYPLKLTVTHGKPFHIPLDVSIPEKNWIGDKIEGDIKNKTFLNNYISSRFTAAKNCLLTLKLLGKLEDIPAKELKKILENLGPGDSSIPDNASIQPVQAANILPGADLLFSEHAKMFINSRETQGTKNTYNYTVDTLTKYYDLEKLTFGDIDYNWLEGLRAKLMPTCNKNTRSIHFRNIRAIYKDANKRKMVSKDLYPFEGFDIGGEETMHRNLSVSELRTLMNYPVDPHQERYRDLFMLEFYLIGINVVDILHASEIRNERMEFRRAKTGKIYTIKVPSEAMAIIEKYSPGKKYLLNFLDNYNDYRDFRARYNKNLKQIGPYEWIKTKSKKGRPITKKVVTPLFPRLSSYYSRHTWATIAADLDIPEKTIKMALGHGSRTVTDIYINFDMRKVDEANRLVIDYLLSGSDSPSEFRAVRNKVKEKEDHQAVRGTLSVVGGLMTAGKGIS